MVSSIAPRRGDRFPHAGTVFVHTFYTERRTRHLRPFPIARAVVRALRRADAEALTETLAFVVLPDQVRWLFVLGDFTARTEPVRRVKSWCEAPIARQLMLPGPLWQPAFAEDELPDRDAAIAAAAELLRAPMSAGYCERSADWPHWDTCFSGVVEAVADAEGFREQSGQQ